jgi:hypothetical protein
MLPRLDGCSNAHSAFPPLHCIFTMNLPHPALAVILLLALPAPPAARAGDFVQQWVQRYDGPGHGADRATQVAVDGNGNVIVTGDSLDANGYRDFYTAKYSAANGALLWEKRYDGPGNGDDYAKALVLDGSGNVIVVGESDGGVSSIDIYTVKYAAADGAILWEKRHDGTQSSIDAGNAVAVDGNGNVVIAGYADNATGRYDYYTAKYAAANGAVLWERNDNGPGNSNDYAIGVVVDAGGNAVVTGSSFDSVTGFADFHTAKFASANGAPLWDRGYGGPADSHDLVTALAMDASGNVIVTGASIGVENSIDFFTAKYAASNGGVLWEHRYNSPENGDDFPEALAVDPSGNVIVTGTSDTGFGDTDCYTAKYNAADGELLWQRHYYGPVNGDDEGRSVAADGGGNAIVTGQSPDGLGGSDYFTIKYDASDGALLWEQRYHGPTNGYNDTLAVALTPDGGFVVTGESDDGATPDYATIKYQPSLVPTYAALAKSGSVVPGAGSDSRLPLGTVWTGFGIPAIEADGTVIFLGQWRTPAGVTGAGIFRGSMLLVAEGDAAASRTGEPLFGVTFKAFQNPVASPGGVAFVAKLTGNGVNAKTDTALYYRTGGFLAMVAREGQAMPGATGSQLASITSAAVDGGTVLLTGKLRIGPGGVTAGNDTAAWRWTGPNLLAPVVREGTLLTGINASPVKTFRLLQTSSGTAGTGRGLWFGDIATFQVTFANGSSALLDSTPDETTTFLASGTATVPGVPDAKWATFGPPSTPEHVDGVAFRATLKVGLGGVTGANAKRLFFRSVAATSSVKRGDIAPGLLPAGAKFSGFHDPVVSPRAKAFAFAATAALNATPISGVWWEQDDGVVQDAVAAVGVTPPGLASSVKWAKFLSLATTDLGPLFTATLSGTPASKNTGLWALDSTGILYQLLRKGDMLDGKKVASFTVLTAAVGSQGVRRSYAGDGRIVVRVIFTDASSELMKITLP